jgi:hypothetical protein
MPVHLGSSHVCFADTSCQPLLLLLLRNPACSIRADDGISLGPQEVYAYLCRVMYNRRNKMDPLWNSLIVAGIEPPHAGASSEVRGAALCVSK